jgi:hypothetical protein
VSPLQSAKLWLVGHLDLAKDALHIYVGLTLFFGCALLFRWPLRSWKPWLVVLAAALLGEAWDLRDSLAYHTRIELAANLKDVVNTLFWPSVILLLARTTKMFGASGSPP